MHTKHKIYNKTTQRKQPKTQIQYRLWKVMATDTTRRRWQDHRVWLKNSAVQAPDNIIMNNKIFTILKIVHIRPDVSTGQLPPYSNSGELLTTDSYNDSWFCTRVSTRDSDYFRQPNYTVCTARCLDIKTAATRRAVRAHFVTWRST